MRRRALATVKSSREANTYVGDWIALKDNCKYNSNRASRTNTYDDPAGRPKVTRDRTWKDAKVHQDNCNLRQVDDERVTHLAYPEE